MSADKLPLFSVASGSLGLTCPHFVVILLFINYEIEILLYQDNPTPE